MKKLEEWHFEFDVQRREPVPHAEIELLLDVAVEWAEARNLGVGGGFSESGGVDDLPRWNFGFGLCTQGDGLLISESAAGELLSVLQDWCIDNGFELVGGFREFDYDEEPA